jgi:hypothetical protein
MRPRSRLPAQGILACALAVALTVGAPTASLAAGDTDDNGAGRLDLNGDVLVNESVGTGASGDYAIRGRLFLEDLSARAHKQRETAAERLGVVDTLNFERPEVVTDEYQAVRAALFDGYSSEVVSQAREAREGSPVLSTLVLVAGVPLVLIAGMSLGRFWARRKRASA